MGSSAVASVSVAHRLSRTSRSQPRESPPSRASTSRRSRDVSGHGGAMGRACLGLVAPRVFLRSETIAPGGASMLGVRYVALAFAIAVVLSGGARAEPLKVLTAGAFKQVLLAVIPQFEASGRKVKWETATVGNIINRIEAGGKFDLVVPSPAAPTAP